MGQDGQDSFRIYKILPEKSCSSCPRFLFQQLRNFEHLLGPRSNPIVLSQIDPSHCTCRVEQELRGTRNVMTILTGACMNQIVSTNHFHVLIREQGESVASLLREIARHVRIINTDRDRTYSFCAQLVQTFFNTPQLGVAQRSPVTSVKNQQHASWCFAVDRRGH